MERQLTAISKVLSRGIGGSILWVTMSMVLVSCNSVMNNVKHRVHFRVMQTNGDQLPTRVILLPVSIPVIKISPGPVIDQLPMQAKIVRRNVRKSIMSYINRHDSFGLVTMPKLNKSEKAFLKEHTVLFDLVARNAISYTSGERTKAWHLKLTHFDYSIGPGLNFLKHKTNAQAVMIVTGAEVLIGTTSSLVKSRTYVVIGLVDLKSGDLLWMNYALNPKRRFSRSGDVSYLVSSLLREYPGVLSYRRAITR